MTKILILLIFKNSSKWIYRFFNRIEYILQLQNKNNDIQFSISTIYGDDDDGTSNILLNKLYSIEEIYGTKIFTKRITFPKRLDGIQRLVILRNAFIYIDNDINNLQNYDYILSIDTDIIFDNNTIIKLIKDIENPNLDNPGIVAPMVFIEDYYSYMNSYFYDTFAFRIQDKMFSHTRPYIPIKLFGKDRFKAIISIDSVGCLYIAKTDIFTKYNVRYGTYLRKLDQNSQHPQRKFESEQVYMCEQVKQNTHYNIYVDFNAKVYHINLQKYGIAWH